MENIMTETRNNGILEIEKQRDEEMDKQLFVDIKVPTEVVKEKTSRLKKQNNKSSQSRKYIYYALGVLEVFFAFRFIFKILGASMESTFVTFIYSTTNLFLAPFNGIFRLAVSEGIETKSILEPTLIIAMVVYALIAWGIVTLIDIISNHKETRSL
ncbi:MAG: hypothetical protein K0S01_2165 [Herbinix sp.]|jgi:hypothetical protein|nr:hypothetical protein [Herbinix sp.]